MLMLSERQQTQQDPPPPALHMSPLPFPPFNASLSEAADEAIRYSKRIEIKERREDEEEEETEGEKEMKRKNGRCDKSSTALCDFVQPLSHFSLSFVLLQYGISLSQKNESKERSDPTLHQSSCTSMSVVIKCSLPPITTQKATSCLLPL